MKIEIEVFREELPQPKYRAQIKDSPEIWESGICISEAVGALIQYHPNLFEIDIVYAGTLPQ